MATTLGDSGGQFKPKAFQPGDAVTVTQGEIWKGFDGRVVDVDPSLQFAVVEIPVFGRGQLIPFRFEEITKAP
jgi:transcription antitermination factor NusG